MGRLLGNAGISASDPEQPAGQCATPRVDVPILAGLERRGSTAAPDQLSGGTSGCRVIRVARYGWITVAISLASTVTVRLTTTSPVLGSTSSTTWVPAGI